MKDKIIRSLSNDLSFDNEISQEGNLNATSRLWIQSNGTLFKQYVIYNDLTAKNIDNLLKISSYRSLRKIPELSLPLQIFKADGRIEGYLMEYHDMKPLLYYLEMREHKIVLMAFKKLSMVINNLPRYVYIGDLHAKNVLVSDDRIRLIDIDGFSLKYGHKISCPLDNFLNHSIFCNEKYCDRRGNFLISRNSDICCVLWLFLSYLMKTEPFNYTESELRRYIGFLMRFGLPEDLYRMFNRMISSKKNYLVPDAFEKVPIEIFDSCSYVDFVKSSKL